MKDFEIEYFLIDKESATVLYLPIILEIGIIFKNEHSKYKVTDYAFSGKILEQIICERQY